MRGKVNRDPLRAEIAIQLARGLALILAVFLIGGRLPAHGQEQAPPAKPHVAVLDFKLVEVDAAEGVVMIDRLRSDLVQTGAFVVLDRGQSDKILDELERQQVGLSDAATATRIGEQFNVQRIVAGRVAALKNLGIVQANVEMIDMRTAQILLSQTITHDGDMRSFILQRVPELAQRLAGTQAEPKRALVEKPVVTVPSVPAPAAGPPRIAVFPILAWDSYNRGGRELISSFKGVLASVLQPLVKESKLTVEHSFYALGLGIKADLESVSGLEKAVWTAERAPNVAFLLDKGKSLQVSHIVLYRIFDRGCGGTFTVYLLEVNTGILRERSGNWGKAPNGGCDANTPVVQEMRSLIRESI